MAEVSLSVVMPVFNEARHLPATIEALIAAVHTSGLDAELVLVDDGSTDESAAVARTAVGDRLPLSVVAGPNRGRFEARRAGLHAARGDVVLLLDARVRLLPDSLRFVRERIESGEAVWNGHVHVESVSVFGVFWGLLADLGWREYFDNPRTTSFGAEEFDRFPKGTGCFLAPRRLLIEAVDAFTTRYADTRIVSDDTALLRFVAERHRIGISPSFACVYAPRTAPGPFVKHAFYRGVTFLDGHATPASRLFPAVATFFPLSVLVAVAALRRAVVVPIAAAACGVGAGAYGVYARRSPREVWALLIVTPLYAAGHGAGMWRGLAKIVRGRLAA